MRKAKPRILALVLAFGISALAGCSLTNLNNPKLKPYDEGYINGYAECDKECIELQKKIKSYIESLQQEIAYKNEILRRFNQVDEDGNLGTKPSRIPTNVDPVSLSHDEIHELWDDPEHQDDK